MCEAEGDIKGGRVDYLSAKYHHSAAGHDLAQSDAALEAGSVQDILVGSTHGDDEVLGLLAGIAVHGDDAADHRHTGSQIPLVNSVNIFSATFLLIASCSA